MFPIRPVSSGNGTFVLPVAASGPPADAPPELRAEVDALLTDVDGAYEAGAVQVLPQPLRTPARVLVAGVGDGGTTAWRTAGAAVTRAARDGETLQVALPA